MLHNWTHKNPMRRATMVANHFYEIEDGDWVEDSGSDTRCWRAELVVKIWWSGWWGLERWGRALASVVCVHSFCRSISVGGSFIRSFVRSLAFIRLFVRCSLRWKVEVVEGRKSLSRRVRILAFLNLNRSISRKKVLIVSLFPDLGFASTLFFFLGRNGTLPMAPAVCDGPKLILWRGVAI